MKHLIAALVLVVTGVAAHAADMTPDNNSYPSRVRIADLPANNFAGGYAGVSVNWDILDVKHGAGLDWSDCTGRERCKLDLPRDVSSIAVPFEDGRTSDENVSAGFRVGYNWQVGRLYFGPVAMIDFGGTSAAAVVEGSDAEDGASAQTQVNFKGTIAGKLGVAVTDRIGLYALAGWTIADTDVDVEIHSDSKQVFKETHSKFLNGFAYGAGVDVMIAGNVKAFAEYQHTNLSAFEASGTFAPLADCVAYDYKAEPEIDTFRVGLTYTFN